MLKRTKEKDREEAEPGLWIRTSVGLAKVSATGLINVALDQLLTVGIQEEEIATKEGMIQETADHHLDMEDVDVAEATQEKTRDGKEDASSAKKEVT